MDFLYFDGACPLCRKEMAWLHRLKDSQLQLVDIHSVPPTTTDLPDTEALLRVLHLRTDDGSWLTGVEASIRAWQHTSLGRFWGLLAWRPWKGLVERVYQRWAARRFERLYGSCGTACMRDDRQ